MKTIASDLLMPAAVATGIMALAALPAAGQIAMLPPPGFHH
jgi:hypothetical protein